MANWDGFEEVVAVADTMSFANAARHLGVSTSHVSRAVSRLETKIGEPLFTRSTRVVALTDTGRVVVEQSRRMLQEREEILAMAGSATEPRGEVRLTCSTSMGERFVAPILRRFAEQYPEIRLDIQLTNRVIDLVGEGYDIGIRTGTVTDSRLLCREIASRRLHLCAAPEYIIRFGRPNFLSDLSTHECLRGSSATWSFTSQDEPWVFHPRSRWRCNSGTAVLEACLAGFGICQLPDFYVAPHLARGELVPLLETCRPADQPVWAVYPQRRHFSPKVAMVVKKLQDELPARLRGQQPESC